MITLEPYEWKASRRNLSTHTVPLRIVSATLAERTLPQYSRLLTALIQHDSEKAKYFDCNDTRLDHFFFNESSFKRPTELRSVVTLILVLSNGQASVERGFNVDKTLLRVNKNEKSIVPRKLIIDKMQKNQFAAFYYRNHKQVNKIYKNCLPAVRIRPWTT